MVTVNVVVLAGTIAAEPVERQLPSGDEVTELRVSVPEAGKRLLPLPVTVWHKAVGRRALKELAKGDEVLVHGTLARRFYRSGAGARSLTEVIASGIKKLDPVLDPEAHAGCRSPASIGMSNRLPGGASGQAHRGS
jgi:single-strand DNA-binding protein